MDTNPRDERRRAWTSYWATGRLHSCIGSYDSNYTGAIGQFWKSVFTRLPSGARVLDLGTGNGALPLMLSEQAGQSAEFQMDAVDLSAIAPDWYSAGQYPAIHFHSGVEMEHLPFDDDTFDLVVSQYGLEYAKWPEALLECSRVLKPGGNAAFVMHHVDSVLVDVARAELAGQAMLLESGGLLDAAGGVIPWIAKARISPAEVTGNPEAVSSRQHYNLAMQKLAVEIEVSVAPDLLLESRAWVHDLVSGKHGNDTAVQLALLQDYGTEVQRASLRTAELVEHAQDEAGIEAVRNLFEQGMPGHSMRCELIQQKEGLLGWGISISPAT